MYNTRFPTVAHRNPELERREAQVYDPFPDAKFGPDTGVRPLMYDKQRAEPLRAKDRFYTAMLRNQNRSPLNSPTNPPMFAPQSQMLPQGHPSMGGLPPGAVPVQSYPQPVPYGYHQPVYQVPPQQYPPAVYAPQVVVPF